jgi:hypothetical protein
MLDFVDNEDKKYTFGRQPEAITRACWLEEEASRRRLLLVGGLRVSCSSECGKGAGS